MTRACALAIALLWFASRAAADDGEDVRASVELFVNDVSYGDVIIVLRDATPWVPIEALRSAGLRVDGSGETYVSLAGFTYRFDEHELQLRLIASPDRFQRQVVPVRSGAPADLIRARNSSAFLNYAAYVDTDAGNGRHATTIATDAGISVRGALIRVGVGRDTTGRFFRSPTHLTVDDETHLVRWDLGDTIAPGGLATPSRAILGVSVSREFGIDPYFVRYTPLTLNGTASTPSIAEVYVNGQLVHRERLAPGSFTLTGLPATIGAGQAEVVLRDTFGREQHLTSNFYEPASLLRPGLQQFNYSAGL